jgi:hypothetical protein
MKRPRTNRRTAGSSEVAGAPRRRPARPLRRIGAALATGTLLALGTAGGATADVVRPGCTPAFGSFSAAAHPGSCWRPFSASSPFNQRLLENDPRVVPNSSRIVRRFVGFGTPGTMNFGPGEDGRGRGAKPLYFSRATDPSFTVRLTEDERNGGRWGRNPLNGMTIRIPEGAEPGPGTDRHMVVIDQQAGWSYDLWQVRAAAKGGGTLTASWGGRADLNGNGQATLPGSGSAATMGIAGGIIRPEELLEGDIPHALYLSAHCTNGTSVFPSQQGDGEKDCAGSGQGSNADAPALGQRFQLGYTDAQIAALDAPAHEKVLLRAMAHYGLILIDTTADAWHLDAEAAIDRTSLGQPDPGAVFAERAGLKYWAPTRSWTWHLDQIPGVDGKAGSWTSALRVIQPCVSEGTCPAATPAPTGPDPLWPAGGATAPAIATAPLVTATVTATATATMTVSSPTQAAATVTARATAKVSVRAGSPRKASRTRAKRTAKARAHRVASSRARARARARAKAKAHRRAVFQARSYRGT